MTSKWVYLLDMEYLLFQKVYQHKFNKVPVDTGRKLKVHKAIALGLAQVIIAFFFKVARAVNLKLVFTFLRTNFFHNLVVLTKLCKIRYLNLGRPLLFPRNQAFCLKNWKFWRAPVTIEFNIFYWKFFTSFLLSNVYKSVHGIFFILFRSWVINQSVKSECVWQPGLFKILNITQDLKK